LTKDKIDFEETPQCTLIGPLEKGGQFLVAKWVIKSTKRLDPR
jgi:hypothetical protein